MPEQSDRIVLTLTSEWSRLREGNVEAACVDIFPDREWEVVVAGRTVENIQQWIRMACESSPLLTDPTLLAELCEALEYEGDSLEEVPAGKARVVLTQHVTDVTKDMSKDSIQRVLTQMTKWFSTGLAIRMRGCPEEALAGALQAVMCTMAYEGLSVLPPEALDVLLASVHQHVSAQSQ